MRDTVASFIYSVAFILPYAVTALIGIVLTFVFRARLGRVWWAALVAFAVSLFGVLFSLGFQAFVNFYIFSSGRYELYEKVVWISGTVAILVHILAAIFMFVALFGAREKA